MTVFKLLAELERHYIELLIDIDGGLRYRAPKRGLTPELRNELLERSSEIRAALQTRGPRRQSAYSMSMDLRGTPFLPLEAPSMRWWSP